MRKTPRMTSSVVKWAKKESKHEDNLLVYGRVNDISHVGKCKWKTWTLITWCFVPLAANKPVLQKSLPQLLFNYRQLFAQCLFFFSSPQSSKVGTSLLSSKARKVSSLVQKWQSIKQQEEPFLGSSEEEEEENDPHKQIEEWKKEHLARYRQRVSGIGIDIGSRWHLGPVRQHCCNNIRKTW